MSWRVFSGSLKGRLLLASLVLLPLFLGISGFMLEKSFQRSQVSAQKERLESYIYLLLGAAEVEDSQLEMPELLTEPRLNNLNSGLMAIISDDKTTLWRSASTLIDTPIDVVNTSLEPGKRHFYDIDSGDQQLFAYSYDVNWELSDQNQLLRFTILSSKAPVIAEVKSYRTELWRWLGLLALFLLIVQFLILRWGLKPLKTVAADLRDIESGDKELLSGDYPSEISPITGNLNEVISSEREQRERYRTTLADLAHSLKTPLAVMRGHLEQRNEGSENSVLFEQLNRMDQIVQHQLQRSVRAQTSTAGKVIVAPLAQRLCNSLAKVFAEQSPNFQLQIEKDVFFRGDEADLMEILGNLLENACKYGNGLIHLSARNDHKHLLLCIEDNGSGVPAGQHTAILQRGARADSANPGHGIGLAVVIDIVSSYGGSLQVNQSDLGGARFELQL
ncbi:ATP-binding protein [Porticoccaceae bacterium LTM1]|nr:ATP-binding protein [Porticoccaceae bacterium LTM1]